MGRMAGAEADGGADGSGTFGRAAGHVPNPETRYLKAEQRSTMSSLPLEMNPPSEKPMH